MVRFTIAPLLALCFALAVGAQPAARTLGGAGTEIPAGPGLPMLHTARKPNGGCRWVPYVDQANKIALLVESCTGKHKGESQQTSGLIKSYSPQGKFEPAEITSFSKPAEQSLDAAVHAQLGPTLKPAARTVCHLVPVEKAQVYPHSKWQWFHLKATSGPLKAVYATDDPSDDLPCDPWEVGEATGGFLYQPSLSRTRFLYVGLGQEEPNWDVDSLQFLP